MDKFTQEQGWFSIEEIYEQGTPVVKIFPDCLITVGGSYLHYYQRSYLPLLNYTHLDSKQSKYKEVDVRGFSSVGNLLKDWSWREIEDEADEWIKDIEKESQQES